jgi:type IV secretory pathway ATPase VirB11/archaellum biosynthesis ATPase
MAKAQVRKATVKKTSSKVVSKKAHKIAAVRSVGKVVFRADAKQTAALVKVGRKGAANAIRASKALGLPITYLENGHIVRELSNGDKEIVAKVSRPVITKSVVSYKKGMILHAKK